MLNSVYQLVAPRRFETVFQEIEIQSDNVIVRPTYMSICHADQRYYQGLRPAEILAKKLPMALIHECIGEVIYDVRGEFEIGQSVVLIPNLPVEKDEVVAENYLISSRFCSSNRDGFLQDYVSINRSRVILLPDGVDKEVAAFTELLSVSVHALIRFDKTAHKRRKIMGIWGDGNLGYITAIFCKIMYPDMKIYIFGVHSEKLADFTFVDRIFHVNDIPKDVLVDHAFECVGGQACQSVISQIIDYIQPEGTIGLMGVSEYPISINTRKVLEKGLRIVGSSRSGRDDFEKTVELYQSHPELVNYLRTLVGAKVDIRTITDITRAFEMDIQKTIGKTILVWDK